MAHYVELGVWSLTIYQYQLGTSSSATILSSFEGRKPNGSGIYRHFNEKLKVLSKD